MLVKNNVIIEWNKEDKNNTIAICRQCGCSAPDYLSFYGPRGSFCLICGRIHYYDVHHPLSRPGEQEPHSRQYWIDKHEDGSLRLIHLIFDKRDFAWRREEGEDCYLFWPLHEGEEFSWEEFEKEMKQYSESRTVPTRCAGCRKTEEEVTPFGGPGDPLIADMTGEKLILHHYEDGSFNHLCRDCVFLSEEELDAKSKIADVGLLFDKYPCVGQYELTYKCAACDIIFDCREVSPDPYADQRKPRIIQCFGRYGTQPGCATCKHAQKCKVATEEKGHPEDDELERQLKMLAKKRHLVKEMKNA
jgi:hypothetical protein